jgi:hypothetical protein
MDESQIHVGGVYWTEFAGRLLRAKVLGSLPLSPGWWDCLELQSGAVQSLPASAFVGLDASDDLIDR